MLKWLRLRLAALIVQKDFKIIKILSMQMVLYIKRSKLIFPSLLNYSEIVIAIDKMPLFE